MEVMAVSGTNVQEEEKDFVNVNFGTKEHEETGEASTVIGAKVHEGESKALICFKK